MAAGAILYLASLKISYYVVNSMTSLSVFLLAIQWEIKIGAYRKQDVDGGRQTGSRTTSLRSRNEHLTVLSSRSVGHEQGCIAYAFGS